MSEFRFVVEDHDKVQETVDHVIENDTCNFCEEPSVIVYRGWDDKIICACPQHQEIVLEAIERSK